MALDILQDMHEMSIQGNIDPSDSFLLQLTSEYSARSDRADLNFPTLTNFDSVSTLETLESNKTRIRLTPMPSLTESMLPPIPSTDEIRSHEDFSQNSPSMRGKQMQSAYSYANYSPETHTTDSTFLNVVSPTSPSSKRSKCSKTRYKAKRKHRHKKRDDDDEEKDKSVADEAPRPLPYFVQRVPSVPLDLAQDSKSKAPLRIKLPLDVDGREHKRRKRKHRRKDKKKGVRAEVHEQQKANTPTLGKQKAKERRRTRNRANSVNSSRDEYANSHDPGDFVEYAVSPIDLGDFVGYHL